MEGNPTLIIDSGCSAGGSENMLKEDIVEVRLPMGEANGSKADVNEESALLIEVVQDAGEVINRVDSCNADKDDVEQMDGDVLCNNRFEVLSEDDNSTKVDCAKDYYLDPETWQGD